MADDRTFIQKIEDNQTRDSDDAHELRLQMASRAEGEAWLVTQGFQHDGFGWHKLENDPALGEWMHEALVTALHVTVYSGRID